MPADWNRRGFQVIPAVDVLGSEAVRRGVAWLREHQDEAGRWPDQPITGVFNRTCAIHYDIYLRLFPVWALAVCDSTD